MEHQSFQQPPPVKEQPPASKELTNEQHGTSAGVVTTKVTIDEAVNRCGLGSFQYWMLISMGLSVLSDAGEISLLAFLSTVLQATWGISKSQGASLVVTVFAGELIGGFILGLVSDKMGRRPSMLFLAAMITVFGMLTGTANSFGLLIFFRLMVGVGLGGLTIPFNIIAEFVPEKRRGLFLEVLGAFWTVGIILEVGFAYFLLGKEGGADNHPNAWRLFAVVSAVPVALSFIVMWFTVPESPRWLLARGRHDEALAILHRIAQQNGLDAEELFPEGTVLTEAKVHESQGIRELFRPKTRNLTLLTLVTWLAVGVGYIGVILYTNVVFSHVTASSTVDGTGSYSFEYLPILIGAISEIAGRLFSYLSIGPLGRRLSQAVSYMIGGVSFLALSLWVYYGRAEGGAIAFSFLARMFILSGDVGNWVTTAEMLPTGLRGTGMGVAISFERLGGFAVTYLVESSVQNPVIGSVMLVSMLLATGTALARPETRDIHLGILEEEEEETQDDLLEEQQSKE